MYFDHVRCPSCQASFDPEKIDASKGHGRCPGCGAVLELRSLFGVGDAFVGVGDDEGIGMTLDDLFSSGTADAGSRASDGGSRPPRDLPARGQERRDTDGGSALESLRQIRNKKR